MTTAPISLYLDLERGQKADLETVARASLAFAAAIRDIAFVLDPSIEIRIELASGTESSLSLNALIKSLGQKVHDPNYMASVVVGVLAYFGTQFGDWVTHKGFDLIAGPEAAAVTLSDQDIEKIGAAAAKIVEKKIGAQHVREVYREIATDPAIKGVGASVEPGARPQTIIPRLQFRERSEEQVAPIVDEIGAKRHTPATETVTLIKPVLKRGKRHWRFQGQQGEFGATMDDVGFVENVLSGNVSLPMVEGLRFRVAMDVYEEFTADKVWMPIAYSITKVHSFKAPPTQETLDFDSLPLPELRSSEDDADDN